MRPSQIKVQKRGHSIGDALFPKIKRQLLTLFYSTPNKKYYFREITRLIKASSGVVSRELATLTKAGILKSELAGRQKYYWADPDCMIYNDLGNIVVKTFGVAGTIISDLQPVSSEIKLAFLYGSIPAGHDTGASDIDLMVIGDISYRRLIATLKKAEGVLNRELNPTLFSDTEFVKGIKEGNHFLKTVMESPKIFIIGTADDLAGLAE